MSPLEAFERCIHDFPQPPHQQEKITKASQDVQPILVNLPFAQLGMNCLDYHCYISKREYCMF